MGQTVINGKIPPDSLYGFRLHLSVIENSDDLNTVSIEQELAFVDLDATGSFCFKNLPIDTVNRFYQLHLSPADEFSSFIYDPLASMGGHNFVKFLAKAGDSVWVSSTKQKKFGTFYSSNPKATVWLQVDDLKKKWLFEEQQNKQLSRKGKLLAYCKELHQLGENYGVLAQWPVVDAMQFVKEIDSTLHLPDYQEAFIVEFNQQFYGQSPPHWTDNFPFKNVLILILISVIGYLFWIIKKQNIALKNENNPGSSELLSRQEEKVYALLQQNKTNKEIAEDLFISVSTVKTHSSNIYKKLNIKGRKSIST